MRRVLKAGGLLTVGYLVGGLLTARNVFNRYEPLLDSIQKAIDEGDPGNDSDTVQQIDNILMERPT